MRDPSVKTFLSLILLNLFIFVQLLAAFDRVEIADRSSNGCQLQQAKIYWPVLGEIEIVSTSVVLVEPLFFIAGEHAEFLHLPSPVYLIHPGRGPPFLLV